jgi:hypothetical protein
LRSFIQAPKEPCRHLPGPHPLARRPPMRTLMRTTLRIHVSSQVREKTILMSPPGNFSITLKTGAADRQSSL